MTDNPESDLGQQLAMRIRETGPISVEDYMSACLSAYYKNRDPLGQKGDFITAPEISQIFGELLGLWVAETWRLMGEPDDIKLVELGPGRGTLMNDALRACKAVPKFYEQAEVHLVEINETLRKFQIDNLAGHNVKVTQHYDVSGIPDGPAIIIANEFFDAFPVRQLEWCAGRWYERCVGLTDDGPENDFIFQRSEKPLHEDVVNQFKELQLTLEPSDGAIFEFRQKCHGILETLLKRSTAALLIIDYGHEASGFGDTLQAVKAHEYADPLKRPGQFDLTTQIDFNQLKRFSQKFGLNCFGPMTQGQFLLMLGLEQRLNQLLKSATDEQSQQLKTGAIRLVAPDQMGVLFKVMSVLSPDLPTPPPFS